MSVRVSVRERISETARLLYAILLYVVTSPRSGYQRVFPQVLVLQNSLAYTTNTFRLTTLPSLLLFRVQNYSSPSSLTVPQPRPSLHDHDQDHRLPESGPAHRTENWTSSGWQDSADVTKNFSARQLGKQTDRTY